MKNTILFFILLAFPILSFSQEKKPDTFYTEKYSGEYELKDTASGTGTVIIHSASDTTVLFYLSIISPKPAANIATLTGRLTINDGKGKYFSQLKEVEKS